MKYFIESHRRWKTRYVVKEHKTVTKESFDDTRTIKVKIINAFRSYGVFKTGDSVNKLVQECIKHGSVQVFRD